jgi:hypothetical protein
MSVGGFGARKTVGGGSVAQRRLFLGTKTTRRCVSKEALLTARVSA